MTLDILKLVIVEKIMTKKMLDTFYFEGFLLLYWDT